MRNLSQHRVNAIKMLQAEILSQSPMSTLFLIRFDDATLSKFLKIGKYSLVITERYAFQVIRSVLLQYRMGPARQSKYTIDFTPESAQKIAMEVDSILSEYPKTLFALVELPPLDGVKNINAVDELSIITISSSLLRKYIDANFLPPSFLTGKRELPTKKGMYLSIPSRGSVNKFSYRFDKIDPLHVYKSFYALLYLNDMIYYSSSKELEYLKILIYDKQNKYVHTMRRTGREAEFITSKKFTKKFKRKDLELIINQLNQLFYTQELEPLETAHKNRIINSLHWYFESISTLHLNMAAIFIVSAFDSFFKEKEFKPLKIRVIAELTSSNPKENKRISKLLNELYSLRNEIAHGERAMYSFVAQEGGNGPFYDMQHDIYEIYRRFLNHQSSKVMPPK